MPACQTDAVSTTGIFARNDRKGRTCQSSPVSDTSAAWYNTDYAVGGGAVLVISDEGEYFAALYTGFNLEFLDEADLST